MLSVTSSKKSCLIEVMLSIIEFNSFLIQYMKGIDDSTVLSLNMLGRSMKSIPLLMNGILIKCLI